MNGKIDRIGLIRGRYDDHSTTDTSKSISPSMKKEMKQHVAVERSQIKKRLDPICPPRNKTIHPVSPHHQLSRHEDHQDVVNSYSKADDHDSMWLTSDCMSPSSFFQHHESSSPSFHLLTLADSDDVSSSKAKPEEDMGTSSVMDRTSLMVLSLLDLDEEENGCQWISNTNTNTEQDLELDCLGSCFPSPTCKSIPDSINSKDIEMEEYLMNGDDDDDEHEPLFWPFDRKIDWNSEEAWKYFAMSPRKDMTKQLSAIESGSTASKVLLELKQGRKGYNNNNNNSSMSSNSGRVVNMKGPSRLMRESSTTNNSANINVVPCLDIDSNQVVDTKSESRSREMWGDDFGLNEEEVSIETVVGLGEFDGHEGIDSEFSEGVFWLDDLPL